jgi:hypothetical protein
MYQRSQVEEAISKLLEPRVRQPSSALRTRIKRLFETDRALGRNPGSNDPEEDRYAFFREAAPGSGFEVQFSSYEVFALLFALQLMAHNWPQRFAVLVMRRVRRDLEKEHDRILKIDPTALFDEKEITRNRTPGAIAYDTTEPAFLVIVSRYGLTRDMEKAPFACSVHSDIDSASEWVSKTVKGVGGGSSMFELTIAAHELARQLERTKPRRRGRAG